MDSSRPSSPTPPSLLLPEPLQKYAKFFNKNWIDANEHIDPQNATDTDLYNRLIYRYNAYNIGEDMDDDL